MNFALTGGIGAGKSTLLEGLRVAYPTAQFLSMDTLVDDLYQDPLWMSWLESKFGISDRTQISKLAFSTPAVLAQLNAQSALKIGVKLGRVLSTGKLTFVEFPLLFESGLQDQFDYSILITASTEVRIERVVTRGKKTPEQAADVIAAQMPEDQKAVLANCVIDTTQSSDQAQHTADLIHFVSNILQGQSTYE